MQQQHRGKAPIAAVEEHVVLAVEGKYWMPKSARAFVQRVLNIAHCGLQAHRGTYIMMEHLQSHCLENLRAIATRFVNSCLLSKNVKGGQLIQRQWTTDRQVNEMSVYMWTTYTWMRATLMQHTCWC